MIKIVRQDAVHQYDELGRIITTWNSRYCGWVISKEFENDSIDWQDDENGISEFPRGGTEDYFRKLYPDADKYPIIYVRWEWDEDGYIKTFKNKSIESLSYSRTWEYLNYSKEEAIERLGRYCHFNEYAKRTLVEYNWMTIFDGVLK